MSKAKKGPTRTEIIDTLVKVMLRQKGFGSDGLDPWAGDILIARDEKGQRKAYLADENKVVKEYSTDGVAACVMEYLETHTNGQPYMVDYDTAVKIAKTYISRAPAIETPPLIREVDEPGYCFHRQPYTMLTNIPDDIMRGSCPLMSGLLDRIQTNREAFIHFIGSLFVPGSYNQQYLVLKGEGRDGKGTLSHILHQFFGPTYATSYTDAIKSKFWTSDAVMHKRLLVFPEAHDLDFLNTEKMRAVTGGDNLCYEAKYQRPYVGENHVKVIVCTNDEVEITGKKSDRRRRIYCEMAGEAPYEPNYAQEMAEEAQVFFSWCRQRYLEACEDIGAPIATDIQLEDNMERESYGEFDLFFEKELLAVSGSIVRSMDLHDKFKVLVSRDNKQYQRFKRYLKRVHNIDRKRGSVGWLFYGLRIKNQAGYKDNVLDLVTRPTE
jgi:hypothetical protein